MSSLVVWSTRGAKFSAAMRLPGLRVCATSIWPNKSLQPTATPVMPPAAQEIMPGVAVAEH
jgi:hypothetical protein